MSVTSDLIIGLAGWVERELSIDFDEAMERVWAELEKGTRPVDVFDVVVDRGLREQRA